MKEEFIEWAKSNDWDVVESEFTKELPDHITERYTIPENWYSFICRFRVVQNHDFTKWFLTPDDYYLPKNPGFRWDEYELESLEYCDDHDEITAFWDTHLPIFRSVDGEYSYYAIDTTNGSIVYGYEPEYEDATAAAVSFEEFIGKIISGEIVL